MMLIFNLQILRLVSLDPNKKGQKSPFGTLLKSIKNTLFLALFFQKFRLVSLVPNAENKNFF